MMSLAAVDLLELAVEIDGHNRAAGKFARDSVRVSERREEYPRRQDNLKIAVLTDLKGDMKHAINEVDLRRRIDEKHRIQVTRWHPRTPTGRATADVASGCMNAQLLDDTKDVFTTSCVPKRDSRA